MNRKQRRATDAQSRPATLQPFASAQARFEAALGHHRAGRLAEAERLYQGIPAGTPRHSDSLHMRGVLAHQQGRHEQAGGLIRQAIAVNGGNATYHSSLGDVLQEQGRLDEAAACYRRAISLKPNHLSALNNLGVLLRDKGQLDEAIACYRRAIARDRDYAPAHDNLGIALRQRGRLEEAVAAHRRAVALKPDEANPWNNLGIALKDQGRLDEAAACYRQALELRPDCAEIHNNLGIVLKHQGLLEEAVTAYRKAIALKPGYQEPCNNLAVVLTELGRLDEALRCYETALQLNPESSEVYSNLGGALAQQDRLDGAPLYCRRAIELNPNHLGADNNLASALTEQGRHDEPMDWYSRAIERQRGHPEAYKRLADELKAQRQWDAATASYRKAIELKPDFAEAYNGLGGVLKAVGQLDEAFACYAKAVELKPDDPSVYNSLGDLSRGQGLLPEAVACFRKAIELAPDYGPAYNNLGIALSEQGHMEQAIACYHKAIEFKQDSAEAYSNLGAALKDRGQLDEALACCRKAVELGPGFAEAHGNLGNVLLAQGRLDEATAAYAQALKFESEFVPDAHNNLGGALQEQGRLEEALAHYAQALEIKPVFAIASNRLFLQNHFANQPPDDMRRLAEQFGAMVADRCVRPFTSWPAAASDEPLRVGLVSGDLHNHPVGYFLESVLRELNPERVKLTAFSSYHLEDELTARIKSYFDAWQPIHGLNDETAAGLIHSHGVQVLIDLSGHTAHNRLPMFGWRPAPVQATWLGYFATTGVKEIDYIIGDPNVTPAGEYEHFTETVWALPEIYYCFTPPTAAVGVGALPAGTNGHLTFGCFNNLTKVSDAVVSVWARVLHAVPGSRLKLKAKQLRDARVCDEMRARFATNGINEERLIFEPPSLRDDYLRAYHKVDIALDPFPYPGGATSAEALWMGVPVLTRRGDRFLSHAGETIMRNAGLADWVADDSDDYVARAAHHASDCRRLAGLRSQLRAQVLASPLFDAPRFARHFEEAIYGMWTRSRGARATAKLTTSFQTR